MAVCRTSQWVNTSPFVELTVTQKSSTTTSVTLEYEFLYFSEYGPANTTVNKDYSVKINGKTVKSGTFDIDGISGGREICSGTVTVDKGSATKDIAFECSFSFNLTWSGSYAGTKYASGTISIPALSAYTVTYNANGGTGAPSAQTKYHDKALTLVNTKPARSKYTFVEWNTNAKGTGTSYEPGGTYTGNANLTLYAIWTATTYKITYNANGGSGAPSAQTKNHGTALTLSSTKPTRSGYVFQGWSTSSSGAVKYTPGSTYTIDESVTLYAIWSSTYVKPSISSVSADRCDSAGAVDDNGTYAIVKFNWSTSITVKSVKIEWKEESSSVTTWSSTNISATGTSGSVSKVVGGSLATETSYSIRVTVTDNTDSSERYISISGSVFPIDILGCGPNYKQGVAIGKPAENEEMFDVKWFTRIRDQLCVGEKTGHLDGKTGVFISNEGYMHLQRSSTLSYHPYIGFMKDNQTSAAVMIRYNVTDDLLEITGKKVRANYQMSSKKDMLSTTADGCAFAHNYGGTGPTIKFGVGTNGTDRGIYDWSGEKWLFKYNGTDISMAPNAGEYKPYYSSGDTIDVYLETAGYVTSSTTGIHFNIPLAKPVIGNPAVSISSISGFKLRQYGDYTHGSDADVFVKPSSYSATISGNGHVNVTATFGGSGSTTQYCPLNNAPIGIYAVVRVTLS